MAGNALDSSGKIKLVAQNVETCGKNDMEEKCHMKAKGSTQPLGPRNLQPGTAQ
jgi:hypothetical protein